MLPMLLESRTPETDFGFPADNEHRLAASNPDQVPSSGVPVA
jgi:hypothetical protein